MPDATLYVVATPIGNLDDLSARARKVLQQVDLIAAEDTRHSGRLLAHFSIDTPQTALHDHNEEQAIAGLIGKLQNGLSIALVSDAGTPLINDPGFRLLRAAHEASIPVSPVPGPSAPVAALSVAGMPTDKFCFEGFLPAKQAARLARLEALAGESRTLVLLESVHRIDACVADLSNVFGAARRAFIGRELSKMHEQCIAATLGELSEMLGDGRIAKKGEFVLIVAGQQQADPATVSVDLDELLRQFVAVMPGSQAADVVATLTGRPRNDVYRIMLSLQGQGTSD